MPKRRVVLILGAMALLWGTVLPAVVSAADEQKQGNTQGTNGPFVQNLYFWQGDVSRYGQAEAQMSVQLRANTLNDAGATTSLRAQWECTQRVGARDTMTGNTNGTHRTINYTAAAYTGAAVTITKDETRCAFHVWAVAGAFKVISGTALFWLSEFQGGAGGNGSGGQVTPPPPGASQSAGSSSGPGTSPSPSPTPTPPPLTCTYTYSDMSYPGAAPPTTGTGDCNKYVGDTASYSVTLTIPAGDTTGGNYNFCMVTFDAGNSRGQFSSGSGRTGAATGTYGPVTANGALSFSGTQSQDAWVSPWGGSCLLTVTWDANANHVAPSPSPSPSPSGGGSPSPGSCISGTVWTGTGCAFPPGQSWFPGTGGGGLPPPLVQPSTGPFLGGNGGIQEPAPNTPNNNGLGECTADDGTYSKPGQAALQALPDTSFPGSINPLDYIPWVGNLVATVPVTVSNAAQWTVNTGVDLVVPGECVGTLIEDASAAMMEKAPLSLYVEARTAFEGALGAAGSGSVPSGTIAGVTIDLPLSDIAADLGPWRGWAGAFVWLMGIIAVVRLIGGTLGVSNGGGGE